VFTMEEMVEAFEVTSINPNPARFDVKKAESMNGDHIRLLTPEVFLERCVPYLQSASLVSDPITEDQSATLTEILPFVQERVALLGEVPGMIAFLFTQMTLWKSRTMPGRRWVIAVLRFLMQPSEA
jgi:glutamyl-tRNA synthetase